MKKNHRNYEESLLEALKNQQETLGYLNAALEDEDPRVSLLTLECFKGAKFGFMANIPIGEI